MPHIWAKAGDIFLQVLPYTLRDKMKLPRGATGVRISTRQMIVVLLMLLKLALIFKHI